MPASLPIFCIGTYFCGLQLTRLNLSSSPRTDRLIFAFPLGLLTYIFFLNILVQVTSFRHAHILIFTLMVFCFLYQLKQISYDHLRETLRKYISTPSKPTEVFQSTGIPLLFFIFVAMLSFLVSFRELGPDDLGHLIFASTIKMGNLPLKNPMFPDHLLGYHYGPDLLAASVNYISGIPLEFCFDIIIFLSSGYIFLITYLLLLRLNFDKKISLYGSISFFYGGGIIYLYLLKGIPFILNKLGLSSQTIAFSFIADAILPKLNRFLPYGINNYSGALGILNLLCLIYLFLIIHKKNKTSLLDFALFLILYGLLALNLETGFVVFSFCLPFVLTFDFVKKTIHKEKLIHWALCILFSLPIVVLQGGIITTVFHNLFSPLPLMTNDFGASGKHLFTLNSLPLKIFFSQGNGNFYSFFSFQFWMEFFITPIISIFSIRKIFSHKESSTLSLIFFIGLVSFCIPVLVNYQTRPWELPRLFTISTPIFSMLSILYIGDQLLRKNNQLKYKFIFATFFLAINLSGFLFQISLIASPWTQFGSVASVSHTGKLSPISNEEIALYDWIKHHAPARSRFFPYSPRLIIETGRFSPGNYPTLFPHNAIELYENIATHCEFSSLNFFGITHIIVGGKFFPEKDFQNFCNIKFFKNLKTISSSNIDISIWEVQTHSEVK